MRMDSIAMFLTLFIGNPAWVLPGGVRDWYAHFQPPPRLAPIKIAGAPTWSPDPSISFAESLQSDMTDRKSFEVSFRVVFREGYIRLNLLASFHLPQLLAGDDCFCGTRTGTKYSVCIQDLCKRCHSSLAPINVRLPCPLSNGRQQSPR